jgi:hypothetical protein
MSSKTYETHWLTDLNQASHELRQAATVLQNIAERLQQGQPRCIMRGTAEATELDYIAAQMGAHCRDLEDAIERMEHERDGRTAA